MYKNRANSERGQVLLIALLVMVVGLTVGLSVVARSITNIKISTQNEESQRAFFAAEAGLEVALLPNGAVGSGSVGSANYNVTATETSPANNIFIFPATVKVDDTRTLWLVKHDPADSTKLMDSSAYYTAQTINVCWQDASTTPAMEIILIYKEGGNTYRVARGAYDPDGGRGNNFSGVTSSSPPNCGSADLKYRKSISFTGDFNVNPADKILVALRLRPIYADVKIAVEGASAAGSCPGGNGCLPAQGKLFASTGTDANTTRKVQVFKSYPAFPAIFDFVLFSGTGLSKTP
ncbi:hypothetical protein HY439_01190 [Candidatus Microgenomates bacterium]|nr:hypothetical protein [Candidatus Microgenomates bacterium]